MVNKTRCNLCIVISHRFREHNRYGRSMQGATSIAFTVLDVLGYLEEIPVCVGYEIYEYLAGWKCDIRGIKKYDELPRNCRNYIQFIEKEIGVKIAMVSNGPGRNDIIYR